MKIQLFLIGIVMWAGSSCWNRDPGLNEEEIQAELNNESVNNKMLAEIPEGYIPPAGMQYIAERKVNKTLLRLNVLSALQNRQSVKLSDFGKEMVYYRLGDIGPGALEQIVAVPEGYLALTSSGVWLLKNDFTIKKQLIKHEVEVKSGSIMPFLSCPSLVKNLFYDENNRTVSYIVVYDNNTSSSKRFVGTALLDDWLNLDYPLKPEELKKKIDAGQARYIFPIQEGYGLAGSGIEGLYTFNSRGDTLCHFLPGNPTFKKNKGTVRNAEGDNLYMYKGKTYYRRAFTDTIFSTGNGFIFYPVYFLDMGKNRPSRSQGMAISSDLSDKYLIWDFCETNEHLFFQITRNYACPATIQNGSVQFFSFIYEKNTGKLYSFVNPDSPSRFAYIPNNLDGGIPFWPNMQIDGKPYMRTSLLLLKRFFPDRKWKDVPALKGLKEDEDILITIK